MTEFIMIVVASLLLATIVVLLDRHIHEKTAYPESVTSDQFSYLQELAEDRQRARHSEDGP